MGSEKSLGETLSRGMEWLGGIELEATYSEDSGTFEGCREEVFRCTHCELSTSFAGHTTAIFTHCVLFGGLGFVFTSTFFDASGFVTSALVDTTNFFAGAFFTATFALAITTLLATVFTTTTSRAGLCATLFALLTAVETGFFVVFTDRFTSLLA